MRKFITGRLALTLFFVAIPILFQFIPQRGLPEVFRICSTAPYQITERFFTYYGFPGTVVVTATVIDHCSGNQTTDIYDPFRINGLSIDILFVVFWGTLSYWFSSLLQRFSARESMMENFVTRRLALTLFFVAVFALYQFIPQRGRSLINVCGVDPYGTSETFHTSYGFPMMAVDTYTNIDHCSGNQTTNIYGLSIESLFGNMGLFVDILFVVILGTLPYWFSSLLHRFRYLFRRRDNAE